MGGGVGYTCLTQTYYKGGWHVPHLKLGTYVLLGAIYSGGGHVLEYVFLHKPSTRALVGMWVMEGTGTRVLLWYLRTVCVYTSTAVFY